MRGAVAEAPIRTMEGYAPRPNLYAVPNFAPEAGELLVHSVREAEFEAESQARFRQWLGSVMLQEVPNVNQPEKKATDTNILEMIRAAKNGSREALDMVTINASKTIAEACFKDNHVTRAVMHLNNDGELVQFGQSLTSIQTNAVINRPGRHPKLQEITRAEALNAHRIEDAARAGKLKDYYYVVASLVPEGVPEDQLGHKGDGYFLDGMTYVVQATTEQPNNQFTTDSAFMAGVEAGQDDSFGTRSAKRHDFAALAKVSTKLNQKPQFTAADYLNNGWYIPKSMMPNGVVDVMRWCQEATDEIKGRHVERKPEDYMALVLESKRREASLEDIRHQVVSDLLASAESLKTPAEAAKQIWKLVRKHVTKAAFTNEHIDPKVLGRAAAPLITQIRGYLRNGQEELAYGLMDKAAKKVVIGGCGGGDEDEQIQAELAGLRPRGKGGGEKDRYGSRKFKCSKGHENIRPHNQLIEHCQVCGISVKC
jgi:hypothetical protein